MAREQRTAESPLSTHSGSFHCIITSILRLLCTTSIGLERVGTVLSVSCRPWLRIAVSRVLVAVLVLIILELAQLWEFLLIVLHLHFIFAGLLSLRGIRHRASLLAPVVLP